MADDSDKKTKTYTGTMKRIDKQGSGYIVPDMEIIAFSSSLPSNTIQEGDRVKFSIKFSESNPQFEAIDVVPLKTQCSKCRKFGHTIKECRKGFPISRVRCYRCGSIGHFARNCDKIHRKVSSPESSSSGSLSVGSSSSSVVCVKERDDVKKVEEVEDCFILEFDPTENSNSRDGGDTERKKKKEEEKGKEKGKEKKEEKEEEEKNDDCELIRSIVCVKNVEDVKKVEEVEDCFILEFDPTEPLNFSNLSICDDNSEDVSILGAKGQVACKDYPHPRHLCATHPFTTTPHEIHCKMCYCYVCEKPAPCDKWSRIPGVTRPFLMSFHCDAYNSAFWSTLKEQRMETIKRETENDVGRS